MPARNRHRVTRITAGITAWTPASRSVRTGDAQNER
jgi:hypothetical protein